MNEFEILISVDVGSTDHIFIFMDSSTWLKASSQFSTKFTFLKMATGAPKINLPLVNLIWKLKIPRKMKFSLWSLAYRSFEQP